MQQFTNPFHYFYQKLTQPVEKVIIEQQSEKQQNLVDSINRRAMSEENVQSIILNVFYILYDNNTSSRKSYDDFDFNLQQNCITRTKLIQTDISDFIVIEAQYEDQKCYKILDQNDWKIIIQNQNFNGYNPLDIHVSLLTQKLDFLERQKFWYMIAEVKKLQEKYEIENQKYQHLKWKKNIYYQKLIQNDVMRTFSNENNFLRIEENQQSLAQILTAYANFDSELGYTQGMNFIAANILLCYDLKANNSDLQDIEILDNQRDITVFYLLVHIMIEKNWRTLFLDGFPGLIQMISKLKHKIKYEIPDLYKAFEEKGIINHLATCFQHFYFTILMYRLPTEFSRTILDLFIFEGEEFIHIFIIAMLKYFKEFLLKQSLEVILNFINFNIEQFICYCKENMIIDFYTVFFQEKKETLRTTNTLERIGLIKIKQLILPIQDSIRENSKQKHHSFGRLLKQYFFGK